MAYRSGQLPYLNSYAQAVAHHDSVKPIRNRYPDIRPLGLRRRDEATIVKHADRVECWLYNTSVITFTPDDVVTLRTAGHDTALTASFIDEVLHRSGVHASQWDNSIIIWVVGDKEYRLFDGLQIKLDIETHSPVVLNGQPDTYHAVSRTRLNEVRGKYKPFIEYVTMMNKVCEKLDVDGVKEVGKRDCESFLWQVEEACNIKDLEAMLYLYKRLAVTKMFRGMVVLNRAGFHKDPSQFVVRPAEIKHLLDVAIKTVHADEVFYKLEAPLGKVKRDDNLKYFK
jgi:hypothetical protein